MFKIKKITYDKTLLKVMSINSISVLVRLITGFIFSKFVAIYLGPSGVGLIGNLRSLLNGIQSVGFLGFKNGVVKYSSQYKFDKEKLSKLISTVFFSSVFGVIIIFLALFFFAEFWSILMFNTDQYSTVIKCLAFTMPFLIGNYFCLALLNGFSKYKIYTLVNIICSILALILSIILIVNYSLIGVLFSLVIAPIILFSVSYGLLLSKFPMRNYIRLQFFDKTQLKKMFEYSLMTLVTVLIIPPTLIAIRNHIVLVDGIENMGLWEAMNRISNYYLVFTSSLLSLYLYPKLSKIKSNIEFREVIFKFYKTLLPIVILGLISLFLLKKHAIKILLSDQFLAMESLFSWQLCGDLFKILSSVLAYQFMAKKMTRIYIITEVLSAIIWYASSVFLINKHGFIGASMGYFICYMSYFFVLLFSFRKSLFGNEVLI